MEIGQRCDCDHYNVVNPYTCIERCKEGLECLEPFKGVCTKMPGELDYQFTFLDSAYYPRTFYYLSLFIFALLYLDPCSESPCKNGGTCTSIAKVANAPELLRYYNCDCAEGYSGVECEKGIVFMIF